MADECHTCLLGLIILCPILRGTCGAENYHQFVSSGENVSVPCNNGLSDCTTTTWSYYNHSLVAEGKKKTDIERHERLSLGSDCSLNITKVTKEDNGRYTCTQYNKGEPKTDALCLHVLDVSSLSSQTEIRPGSSVNLSCRLHYSQGNSCDYLVNSKGVELMWVNQSGGNLNTDSRYQISFSDKCNITLTTTLLDEDHTREWRCQLTQGKQLKTSATYTVNFSDHVTIIQEFSSESRKTVIVISVVFAAFAVLLVAVLIWKTRDCNKRSAESNAVKDVSDHSGTYETINLSVPPVQKVLIRSSCVNNTDDVTYIEVTSSGTNQLQMKNDLSYDTVTYAAVRGTENTQQEDLYAMVNN